MSIPSFMGVGRRMFFVHRKTQGQYINGRWTEGDTVLLEADGHMQEATLSDTLILPEGDRTKKAIKIFTTTQLHELDEGEDGHAADLVEYEGELYEVMKARNFKTGVLNHCQALAVRKARV